MAAAEQALASLSALRGVLAGVLLMGALRNALQLANVSADVLSMVTGLLLIASVVIPNVALRIREASRRRALATVPRTDKSTASWQSPGAEDRKDPTP